MDHGAASLEVVVECSASVVEVVSDRLWSLGAGAIEERLHADTVELRSCFGDDPQTVCAHVGEALTGLGVVWRFESVDPAVAETWRSFVGITVVDELISVRPAWVAPAASPRAIDIVIEPGPTFGLGNHATTRASLQMLRAVIRGGDRVLDVGTGSGVLGIGAVLLGARTAQGVDITPASEAVVSDNARRNGVGDRVWASTASLESLDPTGHRSFDVVAANILAPALIELAPQLIRLTDRVLVLSGLLADRYQHVVDAMRPLRLDAVLEVDGWVALSLVR